MKGKPIGKTSNKTVTDWTRVRSLSDRQVRKAIASDLEIQGTDVNFWKGARVIMPRAKKPITIRLDSDLLEWLRKKKGYQTQINAVLRTYMQAEVRSGRSRNTPY